MLKTQWTKLVDVEEMLRRENDTRHWLTGASHCPHKDVDALLAKLGNISLSLSLLFWLCQHFEAMSRPIQTGYRTLTRSVVSLPPGVVLCRAVVSEHRRRWTDSQNTEYRIQQTQRGRSEGDWIRQWWWWWWGRPLLLPLPLLAISSGGSNSNWQTLAHVGTWGIANPTANTDSRRARPLQRWASSVRIGEFQIKMLPAR